MTTPDFHSGSAAATELNLEPAVVITAEGRLKPRRPWGKYARWALAWVMVISVGRLVTPQASRAAGDGRLQDAGPVLGSMVGPEYHVRINSSENGPLYTVTTADGVPIASRLDAYTLGQRFPNLDPTKLNADAAARTDDATEHLGVTGQN